MNNRDELKTGILELLKKVFYDARDRTNESWIYENVEAFLSDFDTEIDTFLDEHFNPTSSGR